MTKYRISGVWKNSNNEITHYAFHTVGKEITSRAYKKTKAQAIKLLETKGNSATTWVWNSYMGYWKIDEDVTVLQGDNGKYLQSNPKNTLSNNLAHLIDYDWLAPK